MAGEGGRRRAASEGGQPGRVGENTQGRGGQHQIMPQLSSGPSRGPSSPELQHRSRPSAQASEQQQSSQARPTPAATQRTGAESSNIETVAMNIFNNFEDFELQTLLQRRYFEVDPRGRPSLEDVRTRIVQLLRLMGARMTPREGIMRLANADWNPALAAQGFIQDRRPQMERAVRRAQEEPAQTQKATKKADPPQRSAVKKDNDDELPIPEGIDVVVVVHPETKQNVPAVFHHQIRKYLIERDIRRYGYPRAKGTVVEDQTAPHPDQLRWRFDRREHFPDILLQYKQTAGRENEVPPVMYWRKHIVVAIDRDPLWDFPHIPSTLSSNVEGGLLEALERLNSSTRHKDLSARAYEENVPRHPTEKQIRAIHNKFAGRMRRFREKHCVITWSNERSGSKGLLEYIDAILPPDLKAQNTTRGFRDLRPGELLQARASNFGKYPQRSRRKDPGAGASVGYVATREKAMRRAEEASKQGTAPAAAAVVEEEEDPSTSTSASDSDSDIYVDARATTIFEDTDARSLVPTNAEEEAELQEAFWPTILHYLRQTGELP
ncbi:MAG: hypothetical protein Q9222_006150, partial [Ikaeria aurantiellina]